MPLGLDTDRRDYGSLYAYNTTIEEVADSAAAIKAALTEVEAAGLAAEREEQAEKERINAERAEERRRREQVAESINWD
jgi:hypothetical protein